MSYLPNIRFSFSMIRRDICTPGAPCIENIAIVLGFFTIIMAAAQEDDLEIKLLDIFQAFCAWPSFNEAALLTGCMLCFKPIERILGTKLVAVFLLYNFLAYLPFYILVVVFCGFSNHFPLFFFVPFGLYVFVLWEIPSLRVVSFVTDKIILSAVLAIEIILEFPFGFIPLGTAMFGNIMWGFDVLRLRKLCALREEALPDERPEPLIDPIVETPDPDSGKVNQIEEMGFTREQALVALRNSDNDVQRAIDALLKS